MNTPHIICLISTTPYPGVYFPELRNIAHELENINKIIVIIAAKQSPEEPRFEIVGRTRIYRLSFLHRFEQETFYLRCAMIIRKENPSVIHVFWRFGAVLLPLIFFLSTKRFIVDIRTGSVSNNPTRRNVENALLRAESLFFHHRLVVDEALASKLGISSPHYLPQGIPSHMFLTHYTLDELNHLRKNLSTSNRDIVGVYIGTSYLRNLHILFEGCRMTKKTIPSLKIIVIGDSLLNTQLQQLVRTKELKNCVTLLGNMPNEKIVPYLKIAHFGISFIPITKGFDKQQSIKVIEYMANNLPVLATNTSSNRSFIFEGINGVLIDDTAEDVADGILRITKLFADGDSHHRLAAFNKNFIKRLGWEELVKNQLLPLYEE